eukprot:CAMPEP_0173194156 /NCGR_PEP_ID=MMETSP1141-20130122/14354_1 /TAXON_ID=483371 /ORGANISM="non described non described, Strain CCMP2298" /LENGTH=33 /DNA_ID= /DNA_START= /DNA_END= /DNA_ORIENTATION=
MQASIRAERPLRSVAFTSGTSRSPSFSSSSSSS